MIASVVAIEERLSQYIRNYADDRRCLVELLRFLGKHPYTRFSRSAVVHALKNQRVYVERSLKYLIANGVVSWASENKIHLYSLTEDGPDRNWALDLARLDWCQWQVVLRQVDSME